MQVGNKFRCYPTPEQVKILLCWIGCQRNIYNSKVGEDRYYRSFAKKSLQHTGQYAPIDQHYSQFKSNLTPWLSEVPSQILRNGAVLWKQAYSRYFAKLGGRPGIHKKSGKQSVWITKELFEFVPYTDKKTGEILNALNIGTLGFKFGELEFNAHHDYKIPASIHVGVSGNRWYLSFNYDDGIKEPTDAEIAGWLRQIDAPPVADDDSRCGSRCHD
jgi:putative transposase